MIPLYPLLAAIVAVAVVGLELAWLRTGLFGDRSYWIAMAIVFAFMVPVDGWMSKTSDPIVHYDPAVLSGVRFPWDIPIEEFVYAFALLTSTMLLWERAGRQRTAAVSSTVEEARDEDLAVRR